jgi:hypothetical protein
MVTNTIWMNTRATSAGMLGLGAVPSMTTRAPSMMVWGSRVISPVTSLVSEPTPVTSLPAAICMSL